MAIIERSVASLTLTGDDLDPDELTRLLRCSPTHAHRKGDSHGSPRGRRYSDWRTGHWSLDAEEAAPGDLDKQVSELLRKVPDDPEVWLDITSRHRACIFAGLFMRDGNEGLILAPQTLLALGSRGLVLELDIYGGLDVAHRSVRRR